MFCQSSYIVYDSFKQQNVGAMARRRPPPPTASPSRPSSRAKDYTTHREYAVQDELDELRNRGVAKFMNQHFTETSKKLAHEKAEADAALADLERRRAQTSEFVPSNGAELNPFDALYVELQQKRADCRRKEKETMLLYQRYKQKFKKNKASTPSKKPTLEAQPTPPPVKEEYEGQEEESYYEEDQEIMQTPQKESPELSPDSSDETTPIVAAPPPCTSPAQDPPGLPPTPVQYLSASMESLPESSTADDPLVAEPPETPKTPAKAEQSMVIDCDESLPEASSAVPLTTVVDSAKDAAQGIQEEPVPSPAKNCLASESFSETRPTAEVTAGVPAPVSSQEDSDDDERSVISGLTTVNSVVTRQVMEQLESEMELFIQNETKAIQKLLDVEEENVSFASPMSPGSDASIACDQSVRASLKAEQMAEEMQKMLDQFQKDEMSATTGSHSDTKDASQPSSIKSSLYPRKFKSPNPEEEWMVYWDEKFEREYFFETKTNKTQWEAPVMKLGFTDNPTVTPQQLPKRTSKLIVSKRLSRSDLYRKKLRKQRMRRAFCLLLVLATLCLSAVHWQMNHSEKSYPDAMKATYDSMKDTYEYSFTNRTAEEREAAEIATRQEREKKARETAELKRKAAEAERKRLEKIATQKVKEEAEQKRKAQEEAERKRQLEAKKKAEAEAAEKQRRRQEEQHLRRLELERKAEEERLVAERRAKDEENIRRPWGCNLPFAHVAHRRCRQLAKTNPIYSEENLLNSFLQ